MKRYIIQDKETGTFIDDFLTYDEAKKTLDSYEQHDKEEGCFTPDFYEIKEHEEIPTHKEFDRKNDVKL